MIKNDGNFPVEKRFFYFGKVSNNLWVLISILLAFFYPLAAMLYFGRFPSGFFETALFLGGAILLPLFLIAMVGFGWKAGRYFARLSRSTGLRPSFEGTSEAMKLSKLEFDYLSSLKLLVKGEFLIMSSGDVNLTLGPDRIDEIRNLLIEKNQTTGFDENYEPTALGLLQEGIIDKLYDEGERLFKPH